MDNKILLTEEKIRGRQIIKFPGGGLELGESLVDCLKREFQEELKVDIIVKNHFYTTDFFVQSAFDDSQVISIYFWVDLMDEQALNELPQTENLYFKWEEKDKINADLLSLIIDKKVADLLHLHYKHN